MEEMVEPDRTILIVSIIGLVIIWGSFFYHKFVQGGSGQASADPTPAGGEGPGPTPVSEAEPAAVSTAPATAAPERPGKHRRGRRGR
jgi:hypothetical protein